MLYTKRKLITDALRRMRVVGLIEDPAAEVLSTVAEIYDTKHHDWQDRNLIYWTNSGYDTEEIPGAVFETLIRLVINFSEALFGQNVQLGQLERDAIEDRLLINLRRHTHMQSANRPVQAEYF